MQRVQKTRQYTVLAAIFGVLLAFGAPEAQAQNETKVQETKTQETKPQEAKSPETKPAESKAAHYFVLIETTKGKIVLELYPEEAPKTVENFVTLAKKGYYDGLLFHRVVPGFVIQTGDPKGDGSGGPGYTIPDEANQTLLHAVGAVGMAKTSAPNSGGSQFYIVITKPASFLDGRYTVFGKVLEGQTVAEKIIVGDRMVKVTVSELGKAEFPTAIPAPAIAPAKMVRMVVPRLPDVTLKQQDKSSLRVKFTIEADGKFTSELLEKSGNDKVDQAVRDALIRWQWEPATKDGKPVKSEIEITIELPLRQMR